MRGQSEWGQGGVLPLCDSLRPLQAYKHAHAYAHTFCSRVTDGRMLAEANSELPLLSSITLTPKDSWEADIPSSQLSEENKRVCGTPPTHTCMCSDVYTKKKKMSMQLWADHISSASVCQLAEIRLLSLGHLLKVKVMEIIQTLLTRVDMLMLVVL